MIMGGAGAGQNGGGGIGGIGAYMNQGVPSLPTGFGGGVSIGSPGVPTNAGQSIDGVEMIMSLFNNPNPSAMLDFLQKVKASTGSGGGGGGYGQKIGGPYRHVA